MFHKFRNASVDRKRMKSSCKIVQISLPRLHSKDKRSHKQPDWQFTVSRSNLWKIYLPLFIRPPQSILHHLTMVNVDIESIFGDWVVLAIFRQHFPNDVGGKQDVAPSVVPDGVSKLRIKLLNMVQVDCEGHLKYKKIIIYLNTLTFFSAKDYFQSHFQFSFGLARLTALSCKIDLLVQLIYCL